MVSVRPDLPVRRIASFSSLSAIGALTPLIVIPALTHALGARGFASLAIGQALGGFGAVFVTFGWGTLGPTEAARAGREEAAGLLTLSLQLRVVALVVTAPVVAVAAALLAPDRAGSAALAAVGFAAWGLSPAWFFIGRGSAPGVAGYETLPRLAAAVAAAVTILVWGADWAYGAAFLVTALAAAALSARRHADLRHRATTEVVRTELRERLPLVGANALSSAYTFMALPVVALASVGVAPAFAGLDRFRSLIWMATYSVANAFRSWIHTSPDPELVRRRSREAFAVTVAVGGAAAVVLGALLLRFDHLVFSGTLSMRPVWIGLLVVTMLVVSAEISLVTHFLGPLRATRQIFAATALGAVVGLPCIFLGAAQVGVSGALLGALAAEVTTGAALAVGYRRTSAQ